MNQSPPPPISTLHPGAAAKSRPSEEGALRGRGFHLKAGWGKSLGHAMQPTGEGQEQRALLEEIKRDTLLGDANTTHLQGFYLFSDTVVRWHLNKAT